MGRLRAPVLRMMILAALVTATELVVSPSVNVAGGKLGAWKRPEWSWAE